MRVIFLWKGVLRYFASERRAIIRFFTLAVLGIGMRSNSLTVGLLVIVILNIILIVNI